MTRREGFDVRVAPVVLRSFGHTGTSAPRTGHTRAFASAMRRLEQQGTRAAGAKKLKSLDLWEMRIGSHRAFFRLVPHSRVIAVGFVQARRSAKTPMRRLRHIERVVRAWSDEQEAER